MKREQVVNLFHRKGPFENTVIKETIGMVNPGDTVINLKFL